ncbi:Hypothetical_protein [Hexamita inflata]|uniref:Hypothetical_protein n=1 Tax=Hexamita inflata TaxID=28002 RepID=A0ABP1H215_9EUKA
MRIIIAFLQKLHVCKFNLSNNRQRRILNSPFRAKCITEPDPACSIKFVQDRIIQSITLYTRSSLSFLLLRKLQIQLPSSRATRSEVFHGLVEQLFVGQQVYVGGAPESPGTGGGLELQVAKGLGPAHRQGGVELQVEVNRRALLASHYGVVVVYLGRMESAYGGYSVNDLMRQTNFVYFTQQVNL